MSDSNGSDDDKPDGGKPEIPSKVVDLSKRRIESLSRVFSVNGKLGSMESAGGRVGLPTPEDAGKVAARLLEAAEADHLTFGMLRTEHPDQLARDIATASAAIRAEGTKATLSSKQIASLEAIILLVGRPVLFIKDDKVDVPSGEWEILRPYIPDIATIVRSVGRISAVPAYGRPMEGTGFVVGKDLVMTNRHVVEGFVEPSGSGWKISPGRTLRIDFKQEFGSNVKLEFPISGVRWIDQRKDVDLAILELGNEASGSECPAPLRLQKAEGYVAESNMIFVVGFPAADPERNDPAEMNRIVEIYEKKRLAPGRITAYSAGGRSLLHDCSTLGGNSGSCAVDLSTRTVVALHFEGEYLKANKAVVLPALHSEGAFADLRWHEGRVTS